MAALDLHGLINDQANGFSEAVKAVIEDVLHGGIILTIFVLVGHAYFLSVIVLGRTQQKNRFDPPSPALTHPNPFRSVSPRYARLHSTEWIGMNLQKEVYTPYSRRIYFYYGQMLDKILAQYRVK